MTKEGTESGHLETLDAHGILLVFSHGQWSYIVILGRQEEGCACQEPDQRVGKRREGAIALEEVLRWEASPSP